MKLYEITQQPNQFLTVPKEIKNWLDKMKVRNYSIQPNGVVDVNGDVDLYNKLLTSFPVQFGSVGGNFYCANNKLTSLAGAPSSVGGDFYCSGNMLTSLHNIHKIIKSIGEEFLCDDHKIKSHILGLLLIKNLKQIYGIKDVENIINKYLPLGDIHACQEELIQAGFPECAKL